MKDFITIERLRREHTNQKTEIEELQDEVESLAEERDGLRMILEDQKQETSRTILQLSTAQAEIVALREVLMQTPDERGELAILREAQRTLASIAVNSEKKPDDPAPPLPA